MRSAWIAIATITLVAVLGAIAQYTPMKLEDAATVAELTITDLTVGTMQRVTPLAANWTDGSTNTIAAGCYLVSGTGGANDTTNTVVLANPTTAGDVVTIIMAATTTNLITIADSGNVAATGAILLDANDTVTLTAATTALWVETSSTDN